jgi:pimeloyl-ACP methyl ester carboxylesterase
VKRRKTHTDEARDAGLFVARDLRGLASLSRDATLGITALVEALHQQIANPLAEREDQRTGGITGFVYDSVRSVTNLVGDGVDAVFSLLSRPSVGPSSVERDAVLAALNGVLGDHLAAGTNPLAISMALRHDARALRLQPASLAASVRPLTTKLLVLLHGLCMNDRQWQRDGHDHGAALAHDLGYTPVYLHYNSGRPIEANGVEFAALMQSLVDHWPLPLAEVTLLAHSMGGLVARSACAHAEAAGLPWRQRLDRIVFLGTPHHGAPLEKGGHWIDLLLDVSRYSAPFARLGQVRSAGITGLRDGDPAPLPSEVACYAMAGELETGLLGDGLVPVASALGRHDGRWPALVFAPERQWVGPGVGHLALLGSPEVYAQLRTWLAEPLR